MKSVTQKNNTDNVKWHISTHLTTLLPVGEWTVQSPRTLLKTSKLQCEWKVPPLGSSWVILGQTLQPRDSLLELLLNSQLHVAADLLQHKCAHPQRPNAMWCEPGFIFASPRTSDGQKAVSHGDLRPWPCRALKSRHHLLGLKRGKELLLLWLPQAQPSLHVFVSQPISTIAKGRKAARH